MKTHEQGGLSPEQLLEKEIGDLYERAGELRELFYEQMEDWVKDIWDDVEIEASVGQDREQVKTRLGELVHNVERIIASEGTHSDKVM